MSTHRFAAFFRRAKIRRWLGAGVAVVAIACGARSSPTQPLAAGGHHVLFIGNSLTDANDLPGTVARLAASVGDTIRTRSVTAPDFALIDHINAGAIQGVIAQGGWEFVVLQQGPTTLEINRDSLVLWTQMIDPLVKAVHGKTALLMVWPDFTRTAYFDDCRVSYATAAQAVGGVLFPGGAAWQAAWAADPTLLFYSSDGFHPSALGTYITALVIYEKVTGHDARALPPVAYAGGKDLAADSLTVRLLQRAAHQTDAQY